MAEKLYPNDSSSPSRLWSRPPRLTAIISLIVLAMVALRLKDGPDFYEHIYFNTSVSLVRDGDIFFLRDDLLNLEGRTLDEVSHVTVTGHDPIPSSIGRGFYAWPLVWVGRALAPFIAQYFGPEGRWPFLPFQPDRQRLNAYLFAWHNLSGLIAFSLALVLLWLIMEKRAGAVIATVGLIAVYFGTQLKWVLGKAAGGSESVALLFWSAILYLCLKIFETGRLRPSQAVWLGFCCGSAIFVRLQSIIWLIPPLLCWGWMLLGRRENTGRLVLTGILFLFFTAASAFPQILVWKCWWGRWVIEPYGSILLEQTWRDIAGVCRQNPRFFYTTFLAWLSLAGLILSLKKQRLVAITGLLVIASNITLSFKHVDAIEGQALSARHFLVVVPFYLLGLAALLKAVPQRWRRGAYAGMIAVAVFSYFQIVAYQNPALTKRLSGYSYLIQVLRALWANLIPLPTSRLGPLISLILVPLALSAWGITMLWVNLSGRLQRRWRSAAIVFLPVLLTVTFLMVTWRACGKSARTVREKQAAGFYRNRWRTLGFAWFYLTSDSQIRMKTYLDYGNYKAAENLFDLLMNIDPEGRGEYGQAPPMIERYRKEHAISGHLWQRFCDKYRLPNRVLEVTGVEWSNSAALTDGRIDTIARARKFSPPAKNVLIELNRGSGPLSDVVIILADNEVADGVDIAVSSDGVTWNKHFRVERWFDALWVWDFHKRPWRYVRLTGFKLPEEASIREIFAFFSLRHAR